MPTFLNPSPAVTILAAAGPDTLALIIDFDQAAEIAYALDHLEELRNLDRPHGRPAGYEYGRSNLAGDIWTALSRIDQ